MQHHHETIAGEIMEWFTQATGLSSRAADPRRYLWTDAFAVCNLIELYRRTGDNKHLRLATDLVNQVHETLGKHRADDPRQGWISGLEAVAGKAHPTVGGLRIGKKLRERQADEAYDDRLEWERDGQYYHYLTKWAHALCQMAAATDNQVYILWAAELAQTMHRSFCHQAPSAMAKQLYWKMSIDLSDTLVPSMGQHDPLDGLVTCHEIGCLCDRNTDCDISGEITDLAQMCQHHAWATGDPLGIGGLLFDAHRMLQMLDDVPALVSSGLLVDVLQSAAAGLDYFLTQGGLDGRAEERLAFRELGLSIGLHAVPAMRAVLEELDEFERQESVQVQLSRLMSAVDIAKSIESFWLDSAHRECASWQGHEDINMVMLATSLLPAGFLNLHIPPHVQDPISTSRQA